MGLGLKVALCTVVALIPLKGLPATFHGELWQNVPYSAENVNVVPSGLPDAQFDTTTINFDSSVNGYTTSAFLDNPQFYNTSPYFQPNRTFDDTFIRFTGQIFLHSGANYFEVAHDDGLIVTLGSGIGTIINWPNESAATNVTLVVQAPTDGLYDVTMQYGECCGPPAVLLFEDPVNASDAASTWVLLGLVATGLFGLRKRCATLEF